MPPATKIRSVHWHKVELEGLNWIPGPGRILAVWPAPIDNDVCFDAAGFHDFADSDSAWDEEFASMTRLLIEAVAAVTTGPTMHCGPTRLKRLGMFERIREVLTGRVAPEPPLAERVEAAARDDQFPACIVHFGAQPLAAMRTSDGHPIWWIWLSSSVVDSIDIDRVLRPVLQGRPLIHTRLDWKCLT